MSINFFNFNFNYNHNQVNTFTNISIQKTIVNYREGTVSKFYYISDDEKDKKYRFEIDDKLFIFSRKYSDGKNSRG